MPITLLITRPEPEASQMAALCIERGFIPIVSPVLEIVPLSHATLPAHDSIMLTSPHGLHASVAALLYPDTPFHIVGERAASLAKGLGFSVITVAHNAPALRDRLIAVLPKSHRLLYFSADHIAMDMQQDCAAHGIIYNRVITYRAPATPELTAAAKQALASYPWVFFGSVRAVRLFSALVGDTSTLSQLSALCLSDAIANTAKAIGFKRCFSSTDTDVTSLLDTFRAGRLY